MPLLQLFVSYLKIGFFGFGGGYAMLPLMQEEVLAHKWMEIDSLVNFSDKIGTTTLTPGPKGKHIFGTTKINDRGQVVIPKKARELFGINNGDSLVVLGDEAEGIALIKADVFEKRLNNTWNSMKQEISE